MKPQYQDIISVVNIEIRPEDRKYVDRYFRKAMLLKAADLCLMTGMFLVMISGLWPQYAGLFLILLSGLVLLYRQNKKTTFRTISNTLLKDCDPERMLSYLSALLFHAPTRKSQGWGMHFYNVCTALYYAGRFEDAEKILALYPKYCPDEESRFRYTLLCARLAWQKKEEEALAAYCRDLEGWKRAGKPSGRLPKPLRGLYHDLYAEAMQYPILLQMEKDGAYGQAYEMLQRQENAAFDSMLSKVKKQYLLYRMAEGMGDMQTAERHRNFVVCNGGYLWYGKASGA